MLFDTSYSDKRITRQINEAVGIAFSIKDRWKLRGIGSKRMVIGDISKEYRKYLNAAHYLSHANIELRPKGIIIHFRHKLQAYSWIMPYDDLDIKYDDSLRLASDEKFICFAQDLDHTFIVKMKQQFNRFKQ